MKRFQHRSFVGHPDRSLRPSPALSAPVAQAPAGRAASNRQLCLIWDVPWLARLRLCHQFRDYNTLKVWTHGLQMLCKHRETTLSGGLHYLRGGVGRGCGFVLSTILMQWSGLSYDRAAEIRSLKISDCQSRNGANAHGTPNRCLVAD